MCLYQLVWFAKQKISTTKQSCTPFNLLILSKLTRFYCFAIKVDITFSLIYNTVWLLDCFEGRLMSYISAFSCKLCMQPCISPGLLNDRVSFWKMNTKSKKYTLHVHIHVIVHSTNSPSLFLRSTSPRGKAVGSKRLTRCQSLNRRSMVKSADLKLDQKTKECKSSYGKLDGPTKMLKMTSLKLKKWGFYCLSEQWNIILRPFKKKL